MMAERVFKPGKKDDFHTHDARLCLGIAPQGQVVISVFGTFESLLNNEPVRFYYDSALAIEMGKVLINTAEASARDYAESMGVPTEPAATVEECLAMLKELSEYAACASMGLERKGSDPTMCEQTRDWTQGLVDLCGQAQQMLRRLPKGLVSAGSTLSEM